MSRLSAVAESYGFYQGVQVSIHLQFCFAFIKCNPHIKHQFKYLKISMSIRTLALAFVLLAFSAQSSTLESFNSFEELAHYHCKVFPIEVVYRLASGRMSEVYGKSFKEIDCYVRQFINKDGQDVVVLEDEEDEDEQATQREQVPEIDPILEEYALGLSSCLPQDTEPVASTYQIWRFYRLMVQHDYLLEWMRAKIRATLGYQAERPNAWMDGEQTAKRLRLDKLFSNQFYEYIDKLMFKDFLHPMITFFKKNTVLAVNGILTQNGRPLLVQYIESKNFKEEVFVPVIMNIQGKKIFSYTIPGIPLLLGGSTSTYGWAFSGILVDRSNIEQIQTVGNKFFHHDTEQWIKLQNVTEKLSIKDEAQPDTCTYIHSSYGTLYERHTAEGKVSEYIARWHEDEKKVRVLFSELVQVILNDGIVKTSLEFPFNSLVSINSSGIYNYICYQQHPSYFIYPDLAGAPEDFAQRWVVNPKRYFIMAVNTLLTTSKQESYVRRELHNPTEQTIMTEIRKFANKDKFNVNSLRQFVEGIATDTMLKKRKDVLIHIYRKAKFLFFEDESMRKECDHLVATLEKWPNTLSHPTITPIFKLWDYFFREHTFNHIAHSTLAQDIIRHKLVSDVYWTNQAEHWKAGVSYGECDSHQYDQNWKKKLNGTGDNSTCYFNVMRGINMTRIFLKEVFGQSFRSTDFPMDKFVQKKIQNLEMDKYMGQITSQIFGNYYSRNIDFSTEIGNNIISYRRGFEEELHTVDLGGSEEKPSQAVENIDVTGTDL